MLRLRFSVLTIVLFFSLSAFCQSGSNGLSSSDVEEILDYMVGKNAPEGTRASMRPSVADMPPEEREKILQSYRDMDRAKSAVPGLPDESAQAAMPTTDVWIPQAGGTAIPVNPDWDAETLRYKAAVEQLGMPPDVTKDAVEMFFNNAAPMRERLWNNIEEQLARNRQ